MIATVRSELLPEFAVQVYPTDEDKLGAQQRYVLMIHDGTLGALLFRCKHNGRQLMHVNRPLNSWAEAPVGRYQFMLDA